MPASIPRPPRRARFALLGLIGLVAIQLGSQTTPEPRHAEVDGWRTADGQPAPTTPYRTSANGLAGWLLVTNDPDWEQEWNTPAPHTPHFSEVDSLTIGERVTLFVLISNARRDALGHVDVTCDIRVRRADGTTSFEQDSIPCLSGPSVGPPRHLALAEARIEFVGEPGDPVGPWTFDVELVDRNRPTRLVLKRVVTLRDRP
jgi:hypothetical protein